jgi:uncharacterized damage-inducible protein DinB
MTASNPPSLVALATLGDIQPEIATTRRLLERIPDDRLSWRPHARSWTLGQLATHIAIIPSFGEATLRADDLDLASAEPGEQHALGSRDEILRTFDEHARKLADAVAAADESSFTEPWTLRRGDRVLGQAPRCAMTRRLLTSHLIHHRAQLAMYLRLLDIPVPGIYGPSADERM